jgi:hypothetical protein
LNVKILLRNSLGLKIMKPGYQTSEFWVTLGGTIVSLLVMAGFLEPSKSGEIAALVTQAIGGIVALGSIISYVLSRTELKKTMTLGDTAPKVEG